MFLTMLSLVILFAQLFVCASGEVGFVEGIVVYLITWWIVIFTVLPIRIQGQYETGEIVEGSEPGAPVNPRLKEKASLTTRHHQRALADLLCGDGAGDCRPQHALGAGVPVGD